MPLGKQDRITATLVETGGSNDGPGRVDQLLPIVYDERLDAPVVPEAARILTRKS